MKNFYIVLCRPSHSGNIGAVARAMKTMGLENLNLIFPKSDFLNEEALARARSGADILKNARVFNHLENAIAPCAEVLGFSARKRELNLPFFAIDSVFQHIPPNTPTALLFGNETNGLSNEELMLCTKQVFIPTGEEFSSLNLAAAVQIAAYEIFKMKSQAAIKNKKAERRATANERAHLMESFKKVMLHSGFYNPKDPGRLIFRLNRLFNRAELEKTEVHILEGILNAIFNPTAFRK